jgi:heme-degrading monooxygenase HmoA
MAEAKMSEFLDFLKNKFAYVAIGEFKPGKFAEAKQLFSQAVATYREGFQGAYLLQEPGTDRGIAVILWESIENMEANQNEMTQEIFKQMNHLFVYAPKTSFYEVVSEMPSTGG